MIREVTKGVAVQVEVFYQPDSSNPYNSEYLFAYRITITNTNPFSIQLLRRKWIIVDAFSNKKIVEGEGVIGETPILEPNQNYQYVSACNLKTEMGKMSGYYTMINLENKQKISIKIPEFKLIAPFKLN